MTMIEKIAAVIARTQPCRGDDGVMCKDMCRCKRTALAVLKVMQEPTDAMAEAGLEELQTHLGPMAVIIRDPVYCWRAMINAAATAIGNRRA